MTTQFAGTARMTADTLGVQNTFRTDGGKR